MTSIEARAGATGALAAAAAPATTVRPAAKRTYITWAALAMMITGSVASLRSAPTMAVFGLASVFLYVGPAIVFLLPTSLVSAELASGWKGGVYNWVTQGISARMGLVAIWCQFAMTIFYYPALLAYVGSTLAYIIDPNLANSGVYTAAVIIVLFWGSVLVSSRGIGLIAKLASRGTVVGTLIPGAILVIMGIVYLLQGNHSAAPVDAHHLLPAFSGLAGVVLIVNNFLAYSGMEMNAVHVDDLREPGKEFPKATWLAMALVLAIFIVPALAISWVIPSHELSLTAGVMQAFAAFFSHFGLQFLVPLTALALVSASLSGMMAWLAGPSKGLLKIGREYGYLPPYFQQLNEEGIQTHILVAQGVTTTIIGLLYAFIPDVSSAYWIFSVMTTQVYLIMYVLMFVAAVRLRRDQPDHPRGYRAPGLRAWCWIGGVASVLAILIGFVPPTQFGHASPLTYGLLILLGIILIGVAPPVLLYRLHKPSWKLADASASPAPAAAAETSAAPASSAPAPPNGASANGAGQSSSRDRVSWAIGITLVVLAAVGIVIFKQGRDERIARDRADQLVALYRSHDLPVPVGRKTVIRVFGKDGGAVCDNPNGALSRALQAQQLASGGNVGSRPIRTDRRVVAGEELILQVYCPSKLPAYRQYVDSKRFDRVVRR
jgi:glutamate:GABA antiporter